MEELFDPGAEIDLDQLILGEVYGEIRELDEKDHRLLQLHGPDNAGTDSVQALRASHHTLARMVALGTLRLTDIAEETGYSLTRISQLVNHSAAFQELVEKYREQFTEAVVSHHSKIHFAAGVAVQLVTEELMENPDRLTADFKLRAMEKLLGHSGYAPATHAKVDLFHHQGLDAATILAIKAKANEPRKLEATSIGTGTPQQGIGAGAGHASTLSATVQEVDAEYSELGVGEGTGPTGEPSTRPTSEAHVAEAARGEEV